MDRQIEDTKILKLRAIYFFGNFTKRLNLGGQMNFRCADDHGPIRSDEENTSFAALISSVF